MAISNGGCDEELAALIEKVYRERRWDFRNYKTASLNRRISKRLKALDIATIDEYSKRLDDDPDEYARLFSTITVKVSEFFREPAAYDCLSSAVSEHLAGKGEVRAWCCGCAGGEEAYSLAILLAENLPAEEFAGSKVFATDIDPAYIEEARRAVYRDEFLGNVSRERKERFFFRVDSAWKVRYEIRNIVKFGTLDIVRESGLSKMDILFCRNLFIYFDKSLQARVFEKLDYSLRPGGLIVLGKAEVMPASYMPGYTKLGGTRVNIYRKRL